MEEARKTTLSSAKVFWIVIIAGIVVTLGFVRPYQRFYPKDDMAITVNSVFNHNKDEGGIYQSSSKAQRTTIYIHKSPWAKPSGGYCYNRKNNWTNCVGDHLLYPKSNPADILKRDVMCLYEPLCWTQLNWRDRDPPEFKCPVKESFRFYDFSYHDGVMADHSAFIERNLNEASKTSHEVFLCNVKHNRQARRNYNYNYKDCPLHRGLENTWQTPGTEQRSMNNWNSYHSNEHFQTADALMFGFGPSTWEHWMSFNKTVIVAAAHRVNMGRCTKASSANLFNNLRRLAANKASNPFNVIAGFSILDVEYIRHYTGIRPIYLSGNMFAVTRNVKYTGEKQQFLLQGHRNPKQLMGDKRIVLLSNLGRYELSDLAKFKGVVVLPYSVNNYKFIEQYAMNIPIFAPTVEFAMQENMFEDRVMTRGGYPPYCGLKDEDLTSHPDSPYEFSPNVRHSVHGPQSMPAEKFWLKFADIYHWPCIRYFSSYENLLQQIGKAKDLKAVSECMRKANAWRRAELLQNWCWISKRIQKSRHMPVSYKDALYTLYNVDRLL